MLDSVNVGNRRLSAYRGVAPDSLLEKLNEVAGSLSDLRLLYLNATPTAAVSRSCCARSFPFSTTSGSTLTGRSSRLTTSSSRSPSRSTMACRVAQSSCHPMPATYTRPPPEERGTNGRRVRRHRRARSATSRHPPALPDPGHPLDLALPHRHDGPRPGRARFVRDYLHGYDAAVFTLDEFIPPDLPVPKSVSIPPAIDPMSPKNGELPTELARQVLDWIGVRLDRPLITRWRGSIRGRIRSA